MLDFETITGFVLLTVTLHDGMDADDNVEDVPVVDVTTILAITIRDVEEEGGRDAVPDGAGGGDGVDGRPSRTGTAT